MGWVEGTPEEGARRPSGDGFRLSAAGMTDGGGEGYSVGGLVLFGVVGRGLAMEDACWIRLPTFR